MTDAQVREALLRCLRRVAPEADASTIDPARRFRDQVEIDSMDFLNLVIELHRELGVDVPEADYPEFETLDRAVSYLVHRTASAAPPSPITDH